MSSLEGGDRVIITTAPATPPNPPPVPIFDGVYEVVSVQSSPSAQFTIRVTINASATVIVRKVFGVGRVIIEGNTAELAPVSGAVAVSVFDNNSAPYLERPDYAHGEVIVRNNKIRYVDGAPPKDADTETTTTKLIDLSGVKHLIVKDNFLDTNAATPLVNQRCGNATYFNNKHPNGVLIQGRNLGAVAGNGDYEELETDNEFALVMSMFSRRAR